jgi:hypothetical protein
MESLRLGLSEISRYSVRLIDALKKPPEAIDFLSWLKNEQSNRKIKLSLGLVCIPAHAEKLVF